MIHLVIRGDVVTPRQRLSNSYVAVLGGRIASVGPSDPGPAKEFVNREGALVLPGAVDAQVHSRNQRGREGFGFATRATAAGGVTTTVDMPYDEGLLVCDAASVREKAADVAEEAHVDVALYSTIRPADGISKIVEQVEAGVCAFKFSTFGTDPVHFPRISPFWLKGASRAIAATGLAAGVHDENDELIRAETEAVRASGLTGYAAHGLSHTDLAERLASAKIYEIGAYTRCRAHVVHCSIGWGLDICIAYRDGRSHCPEEFAKPAQLALGTQVLSETILLIDGLPAARTLQAR